MAAKVDPIREKYFAPLEQAEGCSTLLFYATAIVSIGILFLDRNEYPLYYDIAQGVFGVLALSGVLLGLTRRFYWAPRGQEQRISDFVSSAFAVQMTSERTEGYYNNVETEPLRKAALQLLENCFVTKEIARLMCERKRPLIAGYFVLWLLALIYRGTAIDFVVVISQVLFSEEIISGLVSLEWLRARSERRFDMMFRSLQNKAQGVSFTASVIESFAFYETHKATSGITLSSKLFDKHNPRLSAEWDNIRAKLGG